MADDPSNRGWTQLRRQAQVRDEYDEQPELPSGFSWNDPFHQIFRDPFGPAWQPTHGLISDAIFEGVYPGGRQGLSLDIRDEEARKDAASRGLLHVPLVTKRAGTYEGREDAIIHDPEIRTELLREYFGESKVTQDEGNTPWMPKLLFHGTSLQAEGQSKLRGATPTTSEGLWDVFDMKKAQHIGHHFGSAAAANDPSFTGVADRVLVDFEMDETGHPKKITGMRDKPVEYRQGGAVMGPFVLRLENPLQMPDMGQWNPLNVLTELRNRQVITPEEYRGYLPDVESLPLSYTGLQIDRHSKSRANKIIRDLIESKGYDGIWYYNTQEVSRDIAGDPLRDPESNVKQEKSYIIFHPEQVKHATMNRGYFRKDKESFMSQRDQPLGLLGA